MKYLLLLLIVFNVSAKEEAVPKSVIERVASEVSEMEKRIAELKKPLNITKDYLSCLKKATTTRDYLKCKLRNRNAMLKYKVEKNERETGEKDPSLDW